MPQNIPSNLHPDVLSKPRTIMSIISSKFSPRPSPSPHDDLSKEQRDAALRARGLLPQQPPRPPPPEHNPDHALPSPADIVKHEWAAKNDFQERERERFHSFKFGGPSIHVPSESQLPSPPSSPVPDDFQPPSKSSSPPLRALPTPPDTPQFTSPSSTFPTLSPSTPVISFTPPNPNPDEATSTDEANISDDPFHRRIDSFAQLEASISSVPTLSDDSSPQTLWSTASLPSLPTLSSKPKASKPALKNLNGLQVKVHQGPLVPLLVESPVDLQFSESPVLVVDGSPSKILQTQDMVVVEDKDNDATRVVPLIPLRKTTPVMSTATPTATPTSPQRSLIPSAPKSPTISVSTHHTNPTRNEKRGMTDPTPVADPKRKITNPFKRGDHKSAGKVVDDTAVGDEMPKAQPRPRRLTMGSSLSNLRRSFVGTLYRPGNDKTAKGFDASHLPPSPTIPSSFNAGAPGFLPSTARSRSRGGSGGSSSINEGKLAVPPISPRVCQNIAMHNHGTIQSETAAIEDDETRRMTELAFLG